MGVIMTLKKKSLSLILYNGVKEMRDMLKSYKEVIHPSLESLKDYLLLLSDNGEDDLFINLCFDEKHLKLWVKEKAFEGKAYQFLKEVNSYKELEYHLIMMNYFFEFNNYRKMKKRILNNLLTKDITLKEYCLIRHLIDNQSLSDVLVILSKQSYLSDFECAKIALLEDDYELAIEYVYKLDYCCEEMLQIIRQRSYGDYIKLSRYFNNKSLTHYVVAR